MVRIVKVVKTIRFARWISEALDRLNINVSLTRGLKFLLMIMFMLHLISCGWYFIAKVEDFHPDTWVVRIGILDNTLPDQYLFSIY